MPQEFQLAAVTAFGLEAVVARELKHLGYEKTTVEDGRVWFKADESAICRTNINLRSAERVSVVPARFEATDFGVLFDSTRAIAWEEWLPKDAKFPIAGRSVRSQLHSTPDIQRLVKKAIVERMKDAYGIVWCDETGPEYAIEVAIVDDLVTLSIDTSGDGLHKRGYRAKSSAAPLRETLAAGILQLSYWRHGRPFLDPFCGSGTIAIEAALLGRRMAPGYRRHFAAEHWFRVPQLLWDNARDEARAAVLPSEGKLLAGDIDAAAISQAGRNAISAGVGSDIDFIVRNVTEWKDLPPYGCLISNPPYGERLGTLDEAEELYYRLGDLCQTLDTWSFYLLTAHRDFESIFGWSADRRRKLYNAKLACTLYQYFGPKPPAEKQNEDPQESSP